MTSKKVCRPDSHGSGFLRRSDGWGLRYSKRSSGSVRCQRNVTVR
nr:MAG TPA: hypothetical protein [Caudoviricetes sp.]